MSRQGAIYKKAVMMSETTSETPPNQQPFPSGIASSAATGPTMAALEMAEALLRAVYDGISSDYKAKYRMELWNQVQSRAAAASKMTDNLATFLSRLCGMFDGATLAPYDPAARAFVERVLQLPQAEQRAILKTIREHTPVVVVLLRNRKQEEKNEREGTPNDR